MIPRRALACFAAAAVAFAALVAVRPIPGPGAPAPRPASAVTLLAGAFRPLVADLLWARLLEHYDRREFEDMLPLAGALLTLDPRFERAWWVTASTVAIDIAPHEDDVAVRWRWRRQGFQLLREAIAQNPASWYLRFHDGWLAELTEKDAPLAERFRADRAVNPDGLPPLDHACRRFAEAAAIPGHAPYVELGLKRLGCR